VYYGGIVVVDNDIHATVILVKCILPLTDFTDARICFRQIDTALLRDLSFGRKTNLDLR
jgi:hypothetical protein